MYSPLLFTVLKHLATLASSAGKRKKLFIFIYHRVLDETDIMNPDEIDKAKFTWQMELLKKYFNVLPLNEALEKLFSNNLPPRAVCITFDDGYADNYTNALPILLKFKLSATFFIANGFLNGGIMWNDSIIETVRNFTRPTMDLTGIEIGMLDVSDDFKKSRAAKEIIQKVKHLPETQRQQKTAYIAGLSDGITDKLMMTSEQLINLYEKGMDIGGHTVNHPILANLDTQLARNEILENKAFLENLLHTKIKLFAFPNGVPGIDYLPEQLELVQSAGYDAAVSTRWGTANSSSDKWQLPRFTPWDATPLKFMLRMIYVYCFGKPV